MKTGETDRYWLQFLHSLPSEAEPPEGYYEAFHFGTTKESATEVAALVFQGIKTTTGSLKWVYEHEGRVPPAPGDYSIVLDGNDTPVCVIETTEIRVLLLAEVDEQFAYDGGEQDRTLASWREGYRSDIVSECARIHREPTEQTPLVCERFRVVYQEAMKEDRDG
jgi:uncharacterized protein YhfF